MLYYYNRFYLREFFHQQYKSQGGSLDDAIAGFLRLRKAGLSAQERSSLLTLTGHRRGARDVMAQLKRLDDSHLQGTAHAPKLSLDRDLTIGLPLAEEPLLVSERFNASTVLAAPTFVRFWAVTKCEFDTV